MTSKKKDDLGVVFVSKEKQMWMNIQEGLEKEARELLANIEMNDVLLPYVKNKIKKMEENEK